MNISNQNYLTFKLPPDGLGASNRTWKGTAENNGSGFSELWSKNQIHSVRDVLNADAEDDDDANIVNGLREMEKKLVTELVDDD